LYNNLGLLGLMSGDLKEAESNFNQSITLLDQIGDTEGIALANINLGLVKFDLGNYDSGREHFGRAMRVSKRIGHRFYLGLASMYFGRLEGANGRHEAAEILLQDSQAIFDELGAQDNLVDAYCYQSENYLAWGRLEQAIACCEKAQSHLLTEQQGQVAESVQSGRVLRLQGSIARQQGDLERAEQYLQESAQVFEAALEKLESARTAFERGLLALELDQANRANAYFREAQAIFSEVGAEQELERLHAKLDAVTASV
jgi:tetratricopeptide (TPR) repeat protein